MSTINAFSSSFSAWAASGGMDAPSAWSWSALGRWLGRLLGRMAGQLLPWLLPLLLVLAWQLASERGWLSSRVLPAPLDVLIAAWQLAQSGELWIHVRISAGRALLGLAVGGSLGLVLGLLTGSVRWIETLLDSTIQMIRNIPALALIPLVILWFGIDESAKLFLIAVSVFFPIYINTFHGIRNVEFLQTDIVLVGILLYALLGKLADVFAKALERYWLRWHPAYP